MEKKVVIGVAEEGIDVEPDVEEDDDLEDAAESEAEAA